MVHALRELATWRTARVLAGATQLSDVTDQQLNLRNYAELLWERAVRFFAGADLFAQYADLSATEAGLDRAAEKAPTADDHRRMALAAIADLRSVAGAPVARNRVELI
ncbi:head completion/stabilization protein [Novosphingobium sp. 9]|uniref:head completion/stabilization protein n=1 Tax=Novosphingobium sp. 9 TaxID=2025349 RepID=UPI0021B5C346|nr:head completion/stabilization protein [Novosphingobium sp. 9]